MLLNQYPTANHGNYMSNHLYISSIIYIFENPFFHHFVPCFYQVVGFKMITESSLMVN